MHFRAEQSDLSRVLHAVARATARAGGNPLYQGMKLRTDDQGVVVTATDLELRIMSRLSADVRTGGACLVPARLLDDVVRNLSGVLSIRVGGEELSVEEVRGGAAFTLNLIDGDLPNAPGEVGDVEGQVVERTSLVSALDRVAFAASTDASAGVITGVLVEATAVGVRLVTTDRYRLAIHTVDGLAQLGQRESLIIPVRAATEIIRLLDARDEETVEVVLGSRSAVVKCGEVEISTMLIDGAFPPFDSAIPATFPSEAVFQNRVLADAVRKMRLLVRDQLTPVRLAISETAIEVSVRSSDVGHAVETIECKLTGEPLVVGFNPAYLAEGLEAIGDDAVCLQYTNAGKATLLSGTTDTTFRYILMPQRISV